MNSKSILHSGYQSPTLRFWQQSDTISFKPEQFIYPIFVSDLTQSLNEIKSLPEQIKFLWIN